MANVQDVARLFIDIAQKQNENYCGELMTDLRLQKLLYFAQGWHLARFGTPLFSAPIKAWKYGPVVPEVYQQYRENGNRGITEDAPVEPSVFTEDEYTLLLDVFRAYDLYSTAKLVQLTHDADSPWAHTQQSATISEAEILNYFKGKKPLASFDDMLALLPVEEL